MSCRFTSSIEILLQKMYIESVLMSKSCNIALNFFTLLKAGVLFKGHYVKIHSQDDHYYGLYLIQEVTFPYFCVEDQSEFVIFDILISVTTTEKLLQQENAQEIINVTMIINPGTR